MEGTCAPSEVAPGPCPLAPVCRPNITDPARDWADLLRPGALQPVGQEGWSFEVGSYGAPALSCPHRILSVCCWRSSKRLQEEQCYGLQLNTIADKGCSVQLHRQQKLL